LDNWPCNGADADRYLTSESSDGELITCGGEGGGGGDDLIDADTACEVGDEVGTAADLTLADEASTADGEAEMPEARNAGDTLEDLFDCACERRK
jgi:hypothetical protein